MNRTTFFAVSSRVPQSVAVIYALNDQPVGEKDSVDISTINHSIDISTIVHWVVETEPEFQAIIWHPQSQNWLLIMVVHTNVP